MQRRPDTCAVAKRAERLAQECLRGRERCVAYTMIQSKDQTPLSKPLGMEALLLLAAVALGENWTINAANYQDVQPWVAASFFLGAVNAYLVIRSLPIAGWATLFYVVGVGFCDQIVREPFGASDVVDATREAVTLVLSGNNPYTHLFLSTKPPGSPFPYLPGELLFYGVPYALFHSIDHVDKWAGIGTIFLIAALAPVVGVARAALCTALYATLGGFVASTHLEGANDGSLAFLLIASAVSLAWSEFAKLRYRRKPLTQACFYASASFLAWALLFKAFSWPFLPFIAVYLFDKDPLQARRYLFVVGTLCIVAAAPFLLASPGGFISNIYRAFVFHDFYWGINIWTGLRSVGLQINPHAAVIPILGAAAVLGGFFALVKRHISLGEALMRGVGVIVIGLSLARWSTPSYFTFAYTVFVAAVALIRTSEA